MSEMMNADAFHAIGVPGQAVRVFIRASAEQIAQQMRAGECAIPVMATSPGVIRADGSCIDPLFPTAEQAREALRAERWNRLLASDWTQMGDSPLTDDARAAWRVYRQALRDIFASQPDATPDTIMWPDRPAS